MNIFCLIRTIGERTTNETIKKAEKLFGNVESLTIVPFFEAVKKTFEIGVKTSSDLMLALDADVLLNIESSLILQQAWEKQKEKYPNLFRLEFLVKDKFRGKVYAGCHLYNNLYAREAYSFLSKIPYQVNEKRPESSNLALFRKEYNLSSQDNKELIVGIHDYEQYYKHIFAKYYNRAVRDYKSYDKIYNMIEEKRKKNLEDYDYTIALKAMETAKQEQGVMCTDASEYRDITPLLEELGIKEKEPLNV